MFFRSIRFRITFLYMAMIAMTLSLVSIVLYRNVSTGIYENMDHLLRSKARSISHAVDVYWEARIAGTLEDEAKHSDTKRRNVHFAKSAERWVREESLDPKLLDVIVCLFDTDGTIIASSINMPGIALVSKKDFLRVLQGNSQFTTLTVDFPSRGPLALRVFTTPIIENDKVAYIVQVASSLAPIHTALNNFKIALFFLLPVTVMATGLAGAFIAKVMLHPIDDMIATIRQITARNMKLKLAIPDTKDEVKKLAETFNDMLARLDTAFTSQRQFAEDLSHELKTPLTVFKGELEVTLKRMRSPEEYAAALASGLEEIQKIIGLVDNLLILARFESRDVVPALRPLELPLLVQGAVKALQKIARDKEVTLTITTGAVPPLYGDEEQLKRLVVNLIDNAIKYTGRSGTVTVEVKRDGAMAQIVVQDTGIGIAPRDIPHIFERFYRATDSRAEKGFGLGLHIVKSITELHKGTITVMSEVGKGTTFTVRLPINGDTGNIRKV